MAHQLVDLNLKTRFTFQQRLVAKFGAFNFFSQKDDLFIPFFHRNFQLVNGDGGLHGC